jgi:16S rRNA (cytosine967-C5)-methyltransferase
MMSRSFPAFFKALPHTPHALALRLLYAMDLGLVDKADDALHQAFSTAPFHHATPQTRGLATMLFNESLRWQITLKYRMKQLTHKRFKDLQAPLRHLLMLGLLSLLHPEEQAKAREYHHVQAWVDLAKACRLSSAQVGMLNACLRRASEGFPPLGKVEAGFKGSVEERQSLESAWPLWAIKALRHGKTDDAISSALKASHHKQPLTLFHTHATTAVEMSPVLDGLAAQGIHVTQPFLADFPQAIRIQSGFTGVVAQFPDFEAGAWYVQDYGSAWVVQHSLAAVQDPSTRCVVDLCAAPGSKTWWLARHLNEGAQLHAVDLSAKRLERLEENIARLALKGNLTLHTADARTFTIPADSPPADLVLIDAPCSALGTLSHHPDLWWNRSEASMKEFPALQLEILTQAASLCHATSTLVYSTCTWWTPENQGVIRAFLKANPTWVLQEEAQLPLSTEHDAFYRAILKQRLN